MAAAVSWFLDNGWVAAQVATAAAFVVVAIALRAKNARLEKTISYQHEIIKHQERTIVALEEDIKNAKLKQKHDEAARALSDDALRERMQYEGYYRD